MAAPQKPTSILVLYSHDHSAHLHAFKKLIASLVGARTREYAFTFSSGRGMTAETLAQLKLKFDYLIVTDAKISEQFILEKDSKHDAAAGSLYESKILIIEDIQHIHQTPEGAFVIARHLEKIFKPDQWISFPEFTWMRLQEQQDFEFFLHHAQSATLMSVDIETSKFFRNITCIGFSILTAEGRILTGVLDMKDENFFARVRALLTLHVPKIFQNGLYDTLYLLRWNSPPHAYLWDTSYAFHALYSELPKDLGFLSAFYIRNFQYWKTEGRKATNLEEYHRYNAKDCYATLCVAIAQMREFPVWAVDNFLLNFPRVFPCLLMNAQGFRVNEERRLEELERAKGALLADQISIQTMTAQPEFNANSPKQVALLLKAFGIESDTSEKSLIKARTKHPILARILDRILDARFNAKAVNQYFDPELFCGRLYFNLHPCGTETGRLASQKSSFWCGAQIQNYPPYAKVYVEAEEDYAILEIDNEQSESRCTGYMAEEPALIEVLESGKDFHSMNAGVFFGTDYDVAKKKQDDGSDSPPRALAKRINHAVSYNMGDNMFVEQAGAEVMEIARRELRLPGFWALKQIAAHLIGVFDKAYPRVRNEFQAGIKRAIAFTKRLVSPVIVTLPSGRKLQWTRRFFSDPNLSKPALNAAVAHGPQNLSVQIVNEGMLKVYMHECFKPGRPVIMSAQIHDSIIFQVRKEVLAETLPRLHEHMRTPVEVHGRTLVIPTAHKITGDFWGVRKG